ncbi:MAG: Ig-like domain-containing protein, partial [bacterium]
ARLYGYIPSRQAAMIIPQELLYPASGVSLTAPLNGARFGLPAGLPATVTLTADASDAGGTVTNVAFYSGDELIGCDATPPYSVVWSNVKAGQYSLTARATASNGEVSSSAVAVISVDVNTVPVTTGLACWYEAGAGVTTDADGVIQSWADQSGNAHHASLASGAPVLASNQLNSKSAALFRGNAIWFDIAGTFFTKEQYIVVRSPNATWSGSGSFLGRKNTTGTFLEARPSSYNQGSGTTKFWADWLPEAVSKNGTAVPKAQSGNYGFDLGAITNYMVLKIIVRDAVPPVVNSSYQIGQNDNLGSSEWDLVEVIGYAGALSSNDEALVGGYLTSKYGISTAYPVQSNSPPMIAEGTEAAVTMSEDGSPTAFALTLHASDAETNTLTWSVGTAPAHGVAAASGTGTSKAIGYTPAANYNGLDNFTVRVSDDYGATDMFTVNVTVLAVNDAPAAAAQSVSTVMNTAKAVTLAGSDVENSPLTYAIVTSPAQGSLSGAPPDVTYTPTAGYTGFDSFTFKVNDGAADSAPAAVAVTVTATNRAPLAAAQSVSTPANTARALALAGSDADGDPLTYAVVTGPAHGTLSGTPPDVTYTPASDYTGPDSFTFQVNDGAADSAPAAVSVTVTFVATLLAEDFEHEWADNALANTTNGWTSSGAADRSSITNPSAGYAAYPGRVPYPLAYDHTVQRRMLSLNTGGDLLLTPPAQANFSNTTVYVDMMVKFTVSAGVPAAATNDVDLKTAVLLLADGAATNLCVFHGQRSGAGFGAPALSVITNTAAAETWCRLTVDLSSTDGAEAFRVLINGQALASPAAYGDDWKEAVFADPYAPPSGGTWFLSAARRAAPTAASPARIGKLCFIGKGGIDDLVVTYDMPDFSQGTVFMLALADGRGERR